MNKPNKIKTTLIIALWMACLFDLVTFLSGQLFQFESNPIYIYSKSLVLVISFKILINIGITYLLWKYKPNANKSFKYAYLLVFIVLYAFVMQSLGGYNNLSISQQYKETVGTPQEIQPAEESVAVKAYTNVYVIILYLPMIFAFLCYILFEKIYLMELIKK